MNALALQRDGEGWRIDLSGDWSLEALPRIDLELAALPAAMSGTLVCDWSRVEHSGIAPVWALLTRLSELGSAPQLVVRHEGNPPHTVQLLQKLQQELCTAHGTRAQAIPNEEGFVERLGR